MTDRRSIGKLTLLAATLIGQAGCVCCMPLEPMPEQVTACKNILGPARKHVYVFLVNGIDPVAYCNFFGLHDYLVKLGYTQTVQGDVCHYYCFKPAICEAHKEDPNARIVLIGHGVGANVARKLACSLQTDGIPVSLMVYIDGDTICESSKPDNVEHLVNLRTPGSLLASREVKGAVNVHFTSGNHFNSPTQESTLELLDHELMKVALTVPVEVHPEPPTIPVPEEGPTPRPLPPASSVRDGWDFLKPTKTLSAEFPFHYPPPTVASAPDQGAKIHTSLKPASPP